MNKEKSKDYSISILRLISTILIVSCHFLQYFGNQLAWNLNIGVQIFLIISGFLYGLRYEQISIKKVWENFKKIIFDYYIFCILALTLNLIFNFAEFEFTYVIRLLLIIGTIPGIEHLWFIPLILFCYLICPFLSFFLQEINHKKYKIIHKVAFIGIFTIINIYMFPYFGIECTLCFVSAFLFANEIKDIKLFFVKYGLFLILMTSILHYVLYFTNFFDETLFITSKISFFTISNLIRACTALCLFVSFYFFVSFVKFRKNISFLNFTDKYSYSIYLCHQIFILGPLSLLSLTNFKFINILLSAIAITLLTFLLNILSISLKKKPSH